MATKHSTAGIKNHCRPKRYTGLKRDTSDPRDLIRKYGGREIPSKDDHPMIDHREYINKVYDQGTLGSCTANVVCAAYELILNKQAEEMNLTHYNFDSSRLFVYYNSRDYLGDTGDDTGAPLRYALKAIHKFGVCPEYLWPYKELKFAQEPPQLCYDEAKGNRVTKFVHLVQDIHQFRACLKEGFPFGFGFEVYDSFEDEDDGFMPIPSLEEIASNPDPVLHGALAVGYDDNIQRIIALNSWGESYGDKGYFYVPYEYITHPDRAFDFWKIEEVCKKGLI